MTDTTIKALLKLLSQFQYVAPKKLGQTVNLLLSKLIWTKTSLDTGNTDDLEINDKISKQHVQIYFTKKGK